MTTLKYHIIIIGAGPTGLVLANLLAPTGLSIALIEKETEVFPIPRATHIDEETLRNFQHTGLMALLEKHTIPFGSMEMTNANGDVLFKEEIKQDASEHYYKGSRFFDQPAFEKILRDGLTRFPNITFLTGFEAQTITQSNNEVSATIINKLTNETIALQTAYLVGCDGGRSVVRTALAIQMMELEPARDWIIVDSLLKDKKDADLLPDKFKYIFEKERLTIYAHGIGINRRWEFQLKINENMPDDAVIKSWVSKYIALDKIEITRIAKYAHNALVAEQWHNNRIFLAGDAAHMMPPSAGQGLCSGVRDAINLAWKLETVLTNKASINLLNTYEEERKPHLSQLLKRTLFIGSKLHGDTAFQRLRRSIEVRAIQRITPLKNYLKKTYNTPPVLKNGFLSNSSKLAGSYLPQLKINTTLLSDDIIGYRFAFIALAETFSATQLESIKAKSMLIVHEEINIEQTAFKNWLENNKVDFAIIRPDKIIFGAGKATELEKVLDEFESKINK